MNIPCPGLLGTLKTATLPPMKHPVLFLAVLSLPVALMTWAAATGRPRWMVAGWLLTFLAFLCLPLFNRPPKPPR